MTITNFNAATCPALAVLPNIMLVDDDTTVIQATRKALQGIGNLCFATSGADALQLMADSAPDLVLLDSFMPKMSGFQVFEAIQANPSLADIPVIFVTSHSEEAFERAALEMGAADFIPKPIRPEVIQARVRTQLRLKRATDELKKIASIDGLTDIANRRSFDEALVREWGIAMRGQRSMSLLMIDIDYFKRYNDHYGHQLGDSCLSKVAQAIQNELKRPGDMAYRYGGDEFAVILPDTTSEGAQIVGYQILERLEALQLPHAASELGEHVTASVGVSSVLGIGAKPQQSDAIDSIAASPGDLVLAADRALYQAKQNGRAQLHSLSMSLDKFTAEFQKGTEQHD